MVRLPSPPYHCTPILRFIYISMPLSTWSDDRILDTS
uniref:Uncharacterized protein n=1 Tax=Arundo donax TaxID=35708 RepID=A0A0A8ZJJ0_ARUDO